MSAVAKGCLAGAVLVAGACVAAFDRGPNRALVCDPVKGSLNLTFTQATEAVAKGDVWATYFQNIGLSCDSASIHPDYKDADFKVDQTGVNRDDLVNHVKDEGTVYEYFVKK